MVILNVLETLKENSSQYALKLSTDGLKVKCMIADFIFTLCKPKDCSGQKRFFLYINRSSYELTFQFLLIITVL